MYHKRSYMMEGNPRWKGGIKRRGEYLLIKKPEHPRCDTQGYIAQHRLIYEEYYNCCLLPTTEIHHINGIKNDNRMENLQPLTTSQHTRLELTINMDNRKCISCGNGTILNQKGRPKWYAGPTCYLCYKRRVYWRKKESDFD